MIAVGKHRRPPEPEKKAPKRKGRPINVWLGENLAAALDSYLRTQRPAPDISAVVRISLEDFLRSKGITVLDEAD